jgi:hypothetical protein
MKIRRSVLVGFSLSVTLFLVTGLAFAQTSAPAAAVTVSAQTAIVTVIAIIAGFVGQAVNSGSLFGIVTTPRAWIPYLTLLGSFLAAFGLSLQSASSLSGSAILNAILAGVMALSSAGAGAACHSHLQSHKQGQKGGGSGQPASAPAPVAPPAPPVQKMVRILAPIGIVLALGVAIGGTVTTQTGCNWWSSNNKQVVTDVGQVASCVIAEMFQGVTDPLKITGACAPATLSDVEQIIASIINFYDQPQEAGAAVAASGNHCGSGQAPYGVPGCVSDSLLASFKTLHSNIKASMAAGAK